MTLRYRDLVQLFPGNKGISEPSLSFLTVTAFARIPQPKGIFVPLFHNSGELKEAIDHGAVAALWDEKIPLPAYMPNHFIVFYCNDLLKGLKKMIELYRKNQLEMEEEQMNQTKFYFLPEISLNEKESTYDLAVMVNELDLLLKDSEDGRGK
ncbi:hypothetical protein R4Z09_08855 [Niallia oryzisoli]|uniref:Uncharacterized protein n=1 Tax=Niallia oryzisoli TaxID=1737571 RepID=A0ABZ2CH12_9BACI